MTPTDLILYYIYWLIPSSTLLYIILHEKYKIGRVTSYVVANLIAGTIMLPVNFYIFHQ